MKAAIWTRVSTVEQENQNQLLALQKKAKERGLEVVTVYQVEASAWRGDHRPELQALLAEAEARHFEVLLVWALDRLTREGLEDAVKTIRRLSNAGVTVVSIQEPWIETMQANEFRELLIAFLGWAARFESNRRSERIKASVARLKAEGKPVGRKPGAKDKGPRRRSKYIQRWEMERASKKATSKIEQVKGIA